MGRFAAVYLAKARRAGGGEPAIRAIEDQFRIIGAAIRRIERQRAEAEPRHVAALQDLAERAFRRPLSAAEREGVAAFYQALRDEDGLDHEAAVRDTVVGILMSPHFLYRLDLAGEGEGIEPLSDLDLASRLSYFLWASMPDAELLAHAEAGDLHEPAVLVGQARRMLRDAKVRGLATEFAGHWLDFRRFQEHNGVDRGRFPAFDDELRRSMFEEPIRFFVDLVQHDRPVTEFLDGRHTFVNPSLARHYGMPEPAGGPEDWARVDDATRYGRGGLLPMAVFQTANAPGLRTSPVKRGYWVVRRLLGEYIPPPPPDVPDLPDDEADLGDLTLPELLARHRADPACAVCHERFDGIGLAFEGYGPVGELRTVDLGGRPVDTRATFPGGFEGAGVAGLRAYLESERREEFAENLCRKLLAYALGRTLIPSDDATVAAMRDAARRRRWSVRRPGRGDRPQPPVPEQAGRQRTRGVMPMTRPADQSPSGRIATTRRMFLRGAGVTMALPWLETVPSWGAAACAGESAPGPKRFAAMFMGCGVNPEQWWARGSGAEMQLGRCLEPLAGLGPKLNVLHGLFNKNANGVGIHPGQTGNILSGAALKKGAELKGGISVDQMLARHLGDDTIQPSIVLGCEQPITGYHETNFSMAYSSHISWQSATSPVPMEVYPSLAFDSLFDNRGSLRNLSILDRVRDEAAGLSRKVGAGDRAKLDEYLTSVRDVEKRAMAMRDAKESADDRARGRDRPAAAMPRPDDGLPEDIREHMRLMCDLIALGFQTDRTRIATLLLCRDISGLFYPFLDVATAHHGASHDDRSGVLRTDHAVLRRAVRLPRRAARRDARGGRHGTGPLVPAVHQQPVVGLEARRQPSCRSSWPAGSAGRSGPAGCSTTAGRADDDRKLCGLYLGIMDRMGVELDRFGDADERLDDL